MTCSECRAWLQRRLDGDLVVCRSALEHLADCPACHALHVAGERLLTGLGALRFPALPSDFSQRLTVRVLDDRRARRRRLRVQLGVTAALAASLLVMVLAGYFLLPFPGRGPDNAQRLVEANKGTALLAPNAGAVGRLDQSAE